MTQKIIPNLWFDGNAKEAVDFYVLVFKDAKIINTTYYPETSEEGLADFQQNMAGQVLTIDFELNSQNFTALNAGPEFSPNEAVSFLVNCRDQEEIDYYWKALSADGGQESVCGWIKDKYGFSWQIVPENMAELMQKPQAFKTMMGQTKIIIDEFLK